MFKTRIKNIILLVMVLICIYLSSNVWLKLPDFFNANANEKTDEEAIIVADIWKVLRPVKNIIKYDNNYTVSYSDKSDLWKKTLGTINSAFADYANSRVSEIAVFPAEYLKFDFNSNIPVTIFTDHMGIENENINSTVKNIKNVIIDLNDIHSIFIYNGENTIKIQSDNINTQEFTDFAKSLNFEDKTKYASGQKIGEDTIQVPVPLEETALNPIFVQSELDVFDTDRINEIAKNYFKNDYDYVRKSVEVSGNLIYVYRTEKILRVNEEGSLDFYDASIEPNNSADAYKSFLAAVKFTEEFLGFPENGFLSSVENIHLEGNEGYRFTFSYSIMERPILFSRVRNNSALQIDVVGNNVISYKRFIRKIDSSQMDKVAEIQILPAIDVISNNVDASLINTRNEEVKEVENAEIITSQEEVVKELKPIKPDMLKEINNIYLGYFDISRIAREQVLRVVWVIETNEKTFIFNAISGLLIEEW